MAPPELIFRGVPFIEDADERCSRSCATWSRARSRSRRRGRERAGRCCSRTSTTTSPPSSTTACAAGRWSCRSWSRSERNFSRAPAVGVAKVCAMRRELPRSLVGAGDRDRRQPSARRRHRLRGPARAHRRARRRAARAARADALDAVPGGGLIQRYAPARRRAAGLRRRGRRRRPRAARRRRWSRDSTVDGLEATDTSGRDLAAPRRSRPPRERRPAPPSCAPRPSARLGIDPASGASPGRSRCRRPSRSADFVVTIDARNGEQLRFARSAPAARPAAPRSSTRTRSSTQGSYSGLKDNKDKDYDAAHHRCCCR